MNLNRIFFCSRNNVFVMSFSLNITKFHSESDSYSRQNGINIGLLDSRRGANFISKKGPELLLL